MFKKLLESIETAKEKEFEERSFDLMLEDFDFDEDMDNYFELSEGFFSDVRQRIYDNKHLGERAEELRKKFKSKIPAQAKPYFNNIVLDTEDSDRKVIFNFMLPKNLKNRDIVLYNTIREALDEFIYTTIQPATIFKVYLDHESNNDFKIKLSSKRVTKD